MFLIEFQTDGLGCGTKAIAHPDGRYRLDDSVAIANSDKVCCYCYGEADMVCSPDARVYLDTHEVGGDHKCYGDADGESRHGSTWCDLAAWP
jgi:hypothetical protein